LTMEFGLSFVVLLAALKLFPCGKVNWRPAFVGALVSATLLSLSRFGFHYYLLWFKADDPLNVIYGSVGLIPLFLIWLYLVWVVVLFGVEVAYVGQNFGTLWAAEEEQRLSNHRIRKFPNLGTALSVLVALAEIHQEGGDPLPWEEIARVSGMSQRDVPPMLDILSNRGWILETESGWVLGQAASSIQLSEVADAWSVDTAPDSSSQTKGAVKIQQVLREGVKGSLTGNLEDAIQRWA